MNIKNKPINPKKIPYYLILGFLTLGASLILGFLSFGGMYALFPLLPLAFAAFGLSVVYEGEIYLQNIKGALEKLFKTRYLENYLAKEYLLTMAPENTEFENCPQFFKDYEIQLNLLSAFGHKHLNAESAERKRQVEKTLSDMEKWFALELFYSKQDDSEISDYADELHQWLAENKQEQWQERLNNRSLTFTGLKIFSLLAGSFMTLGTTYLIVEAFSIIPFFVAIPFVFWPALIVPMALIAGTAYGMLTYNAITDLVNNDTVNKWYNKLKKDWEEGFTWRNLFMTTCAVFLVAITLALTICTAGTWWTVATHARPLFEWMGRMPGVIMGVINPIITGLSAVSFNLQNTAESLELVDQATQINYNPFYKFIDDLSEGFARLRSTENWFQILNPFRIILKLTITPLRVLLFIGHLISIGVTADRMPGVPEIVAALIAIISEGFEDAHYFVGHSHEHHDHEHECEHDEEHHEHEHEHHHHNHHKFQDLLKERLTPGHSHNHDLDIPTLILQIAASPLYFLAASWDFLTSQLNTTERKAISFSKAWDKQRGIEEEHDVQLCSHAQRPSEDWQIEHTVSLIEKFKTKHLTNVIVGSEIAAEKSAKLDQLKEQVRAKAPLAETLDAAQNEPVYNMHRLFSQASEKTTTQVFVEELAERVNAI